MKKLTTIILSGLLLVSLGVYAVNEAQNHVVTNEQGTTTQSELNGKAKPDRLRTVPGQVLVRFKTDMSQQAVDRALKSVKVKKVKSFKSVKNLHHVILAEGVSVQKAIKTYKKHAEILYAEPNFVVQALAAPNDPRLNELWGLNNTGQTSGTIDADIDAVEAWDLSTGSSNTVVAVIDTGIDYSHEDLVDNMYRNPLECTANGIDDDNNG